MYSVDKLREMKELELQKDVLQPLLGAMGYQDVTIYHGPNEKGKDIVCWRKDELGCRRNLALVVKAVRLNAQAKNARGALGEVCTQVQQCFSNFFTDPLSGEEQQVHQCWVVSNQDIRPEAIEQSHNLLKSPGYSRNVSFIDVEKLLCLLEEYVPEPPIFQVAANRHVPSCGKPPSIDDKKSRRYLGYFENVHGEQTIFIYNQETAQGTLYMGDAGWEEPWEVVDGMVPGLNMNRQEIIWLRACWEAATSFDPRIQKWQCMYCGIQTYEHVFAHLCSHCYTQELNEECKRFLEALKRADKVGRISMLSFHQWIDTIKYFEGKCAYCRNHTHHTLDFVLPLKWGGSLTVNNCLPACRECKDKKRNVRPNKLPGLFPAENMTSIYEYFAQLADK